MHALSLALALAAAQAPVPASPRPAPVVVPVPVSAPPQAPRVPPTMVTDEPAATPPSLPATIPAPIAPGNAIPAPTPASPASTPAVPPPAKPAVPAAPLPQAAVEKVGMGDRAFLAGEYRNALFAYQDAVYLAPRSAVARVRLGRAYLALRYPGQAISQGEQALALDPENPDARQLVSEAKAAASRPATQPSPAAAAPARSGTAEAAPANVAAPIAAAAPTTARGGAAGAPAAAHVYRFTEAEPAASGSKATPNATPAADPAPTASSPTAPAQPVAAKAVGDPAPELAVARQPADARAGGTALEAQMLRTAPDPAAGPTAGQRYRTGLELMANREYEKAIAELTQAIVLDPRLAVAYAARASARFGAGRHREAADDYRASLAIDENLGTPLYGLAECYRVLGEGKRAAEMYQRYADSKAADVREDLRTISAKRAQELR